MQEHYCHDCGRALACRPKQKASKVRCPRCNVKAIIVGESCLRCCMSRLDFVLKDDYQEIPKCEVMSSCLS
jgi:hypothetical protein